MSASRVVAVFLAGIIGIVALTWAMEYNNLLFTKIFSPKYEEVRRETFEQSRAYNEGLAQELSSMEFQYEQADEAHREALRSVILHRISGVDQDNLPASTRRFISKIKMEAR